MGEIFVELLNRSLTAGWLILAVLIVRLLFRRMPKWISCILWAVVAVRLIVPVSLESEYSLLPSAEPIRSSTLENGKLLPYIPSIESNYSVVENTVNPILKETFSYQEADKAPLKTVTTIAGGIWFGGMLLFLFSAVVSVIRLKLIVREGVSYQENVYICDSVKSPFILGIVRPRIYLSSAVNEAEMPYIIAHEKAHLKRMDHLWKPLGYVLLCTYWFQPLCWIAYRMLCKDIELACDEKVIRKLNFQHKKAYSRTLLSCAAQRRWVMSCPLAFGEVGVKERVKSVLKYKRPAFWLTGIAMLVCVILSVGFLTNPEKEYQIRITIPAGSTEAVCYSDEEICPDGKKLTIRSGDGLGDTEVVLLPVEGEKEKVYEPTYLTPGLPVRFDVEQNTWYKIGVNVQNETAEDKDVYVTVRNVEVRISSKDEPKALLDLAYYLELTTPAIDFQNMSGERKEEILSEYDDLLKDYEWMARESADGRSAYLLGCYKNDGEESPLNNLYAMGYYSGDLQKEFQILYREENAETIEKVISEQGVLAVTTEGYVIENSYLYWIYGGAYILIQPNDSIINLWDTFQIYHSRGCEYIDDALSRGIAFYPIEQPYLNIYLLSEKYGEICEKIALTEEEASKILAEEPAGLEEGYGFAAGLEVNGESFYYSEKNVPQTILNLAVEKCGYRFESPAHILSVVEARFEWNWLEEPVYLEEAYLPRLEEILRNAQFQGVGGCGYGAKVILGFENGETMTVFKGTDDCGSLVFGSYGGYSLSDEADKEFWEMFGIGATSEERWEDRAK